MTDTEVHLGSRWTHKNHHMRYTVILFTNQYSRIEKHPVTVVYIGDNGNYWSRPLSTWHESMIPIHEIEGDLQ